MAPEQPYSIVYAPQVKQHLRVIERKYHSLIQQKIEEQLLFEPTIETTNRKPLRSPLFEATWELRFGPNNCFRVFYEVDSDQLQVDILAIGVKERNSLLIGGEEIEL